MEQIFGQATLLTYYLILGLLALFGGHRLQLLLLYYRTRRSNTPEPEAPTEWPDVTVQLPLFNEMYVADRLIRSVCQLDYPREHLHVQVLDDSTDETREIVAATVAEYRSRGFSIEHLHRSDRTGFKAGALEAGMKNACGDFLTVFDADFVPRADYLKRIVPYFTDPESGAGLGMVQACWDHINRDYSLLTRIQAVFLDGHFLIEHAARNRSGRFFNFNGTAGMWRRQAIEDAGGWQHDTLTEDLDLSYRAQLAGWRFLFLPHLKVPAELPVEVNAFKRQQFRWAKGSIQTGRKLLPTILRTSLPWKVKFEALIHLTNNISYLMMVGLSLLIFPAMTVRRGTEMWSLLTIDLPLFLCATVSVLLFYLASQLAAGRGLGRGLRHLAPLMGLGIGLAINNSRAVIQGLGKEVGVFERTPKYRIEGEGDRWFGKKYRVRADLSTVLEGILAAWFVCAFVLALKMGMWMSLPFLYLFLQGFCYMYLLSMFSASWSRWRPTEPAPS
ncbi:MAG: glycosyltransferase family 2 protein [Acidobacteriota bacterium]|nr:glycosyltransferase family 2 protein [Acidobacteriota bacterium]